MEPPEPPDESDCCNSGCNPCILDVYEAQLQKYKDNLKKSTLRPLEVNSISPSSYTIFVVVAVRRISPTVLLLKFEYADTKDKTPNCFKYNCGQYLLLRGQDGDGEFTRAYTPIPVENEIKLGFTTLVRVYPFGRMSRLLKKLQVGDKTSWRGPYGDFTINYNYKYLLFIAQGTGIAPVFSVISEIINNPECESFIKLFFCCCDCDDILLRNELYDLGAYWNFSCEIFLSNSNNLVKKYNEVVHECKLTTNIVTNYINGKNNLQTLICGSDNFTQFFKNEVEKLVESNNVYLF
ncbi:hypothetical protein Zmor_003922 [Zophobas morio]|uniref:FAD-binding FR-type domain-containing protein n=1 Tax=Zophobas morio TaxID=2755281 RepID=A0AA38HMK9_9CUCU|nr:hypothetical protein Zmor_003922 [Zophobas morio]